MREQKKQNVLTAIIIILVLALVIMVGSIVYEEIINMSKQQSQNVNSPAINEDIEDVNEDETEVTENDNTIDDENEVTETENDEELPKEETKEEEYIGEEEKTTEEEPEISTDQKVIDLVKKEWGQDNSVIFSIEKKNGTKYRVAVRDSSTTVLAWYEVDTQNWKVSEY